MPDSLRSLLHDKIKIQSQIWHLDEVIKNLTASNKFPDAQAVINEAIVQLRLPLDVWEHEGTTVTAEIIKNRKNLQDVLVANFSKDRIATL